MRMCKYSRHSYLDLSLISGVPRKGTFSLLNEYRRETDKGEQKGDGCSDATLSSKDSRVYSSILDDKSRVKMIGCHLWVVGLFVGQSSHPLRFYDFLLQILFQEIKSGHL